jgi:hypothetical protein
VGERREGDHIKDIIGGKGIGKAAAALATKELVTARNNNGSHYDK